MEESTMNHHLLCLALAAVLACGGSNSNNDETAQSGSEPDDPGSYSLEGVELSWDFQENEVVFTLSAPTTGWISIGFEPSSAMLDADIIIGFVEDGSLELSDQWGDGYTSHSPDTLLDGSYDITAISGTESDGITTIVFSRPLSSGDERDHDLEPGGTYDVLLAYGPAGSDDYTSKHEWVKVVEITLN